MIDIHSWNTQQPLATHNGIQKTVFRCCPRRGMEMIQFRCGEKRCMSIFWVPVFIKVRNYCLVWTRCRSPIYLCLFDVVLEQRSRIDVKSFVGAFFCFRKSISQSTAQADPSYTTFYAAQVLASRTPLSLHSPCPKSAQRT